MKKAAKSMCNGLSTLATLPLFGLYLLGCFCLGSAKVFPGWSQAYSLFPGISGAYLRRAFYRMVLPRCGSGSWISFGSVFSHPTATVGRNVYVGLYCCLGDVALGDDVLLGSHVSIMNGSGQHGIARLDIPIREQPGSWPKIRIGEDTWIGDRAIVMADVGAHCVIGAGSVVTKAIPDYAIAVGVPAKIVRFRNESESPDPAKEADAEQLLHA